MLVEKIGTNIYAMSFVSPTTISDNATPVHHDRQKWQFSILFISSKWVLVCQYSMIPHFIPRHIAQLDAKATNATTIAKSNISNTFELTSLFCLPP